MEEWDFTVSGRLFHKKDKRGKKTQKELSYSVSLDVGSFYPGGEFLEECVLSEVPREFGGLREQVELYQRRDGKNRESTDLTAM